MTTAVFRAILPKHKAGLGRRVVQQIQAAMQGDIRKIKSDFESTTSTWEHKPDFKEQVLKSAGALVAMVYTEDEIYRFVDRGTKEHPIPRVPGRPLRFQWGGPGSYKAKTSPGQIGSRGGGATGDIVFFKSVWHPGTEGRKFPEVVKEKWQGPVVHHIIDGIKNVI